MKSGWLWKAAVFLTAILLLAFTFGALSFIYQPKGAEELRLMIAEKRKTLETLEENQRKAQEELETVRREVAPLLKEWGDELEELDPSIAQLAEAARPNVVVHRLATHPFQDVLVLPAVVEAHEDILLASKTEGPVEWIGPKEGDTIDAGTEIAKVDANRLVHEVRRAESVARMAELKFNRIQALRKKGVASQDELDNAQSEFDQFRALLGIARKDLEDATLTSPIDGRIDDIGPDVGEFVNRGEVVTHIVDTRRVKFVVQVPEKDILFFHEGQSVRVEQPQPLEGYTSGTITRVGIVAEEMSKTYALEVTVDNPGGIYRPGMIARVELVRQKRSHAIVVPMFAVIQTQNGPIAYVEEDGIAHSRAVQTGIRRGALLEVVSGLEEGDRLIVQGQRTLGDGVKVRVVQEVDDQGDPMSSGTLGVSETAGQMEAANETL